MNGNPVEPNTDAAWGAWGRVDPYFGVLTDAKFRLANLDQPALDEFFASGQWHADEILEVIRDID